MQTVTSTDIQRSFPRILSNLDEPVAIMRDNRFEAVLVNYQDYLDMKELEKKNRAEKIFAMLDKVHAQNAHIPAKQVERDVEEALKYVRSRRRHQHLS